MKISPKHRTRIISRILFLRVVFTSPFYMAGIVNPSRVAPYCWILYMEAFHHFHARIFYLLAMYRNGLQCFFSRQRGWPRLAFMLGEACFDTSVVLLFIHEHQRYHYSRFLSAPFAATVFNALLSFLLVGLSASDIEQDHIV